MITKFKKTLLAFFLIIILANISIASNNSSYHNETNNTIILNNHFLNNTNKTNLIYLQSSYICYPYNLTNHSSLGECLTFTIYGLDKIAENLDNAFVYKA